MKFFTAVSVALLITFGASAANYVVIGAFAKKSNAIKLAKRAKAEFEINPVKQLYYVFVLKTDDHDKAFAEAIRLQTETEYKDAWVFVGGLGENGGGEDVLVEGERIKQKNVERENVEQKKTIEIIAPEPVIERTKEEPEKETPTELKQDPKDEPKEEPKTELKTELKTDPKEEPRVETIAGPTEERVEESKTEVKDIALDPTVSSKDFYFLVTRESGDKINGAEITAIDPKTNFKQGHFEGNQDVTMRAINQSGDVRFECDLAGYRKVIQTINFKTPVEEDGIMIKDNRIIVPFSLVRLKKGDHAILYNVFFFKDAALMRPESKFDLDGLLNMMKENEKYRIKIHGHTNGNAAGKILEAGDSDNYFTLSGAKETAGSARKLSEKRAEVIREYLIKNGISADRMSIKAWGGKSPIYDKHSNQAAANVRVEIEVLEE